MKDRSRSDNMPYLLEGWWGRKDPKGKLIDGVVLAWKPDLGAARATIDFATSIGRLNSEGQVGSSEPQSRDTSGGGKRHTGYVVS